MRILFEPNGEGGGTNTPPAPAPAPAAPATQQAAPIKEGTMPEHMKGMEINLEEIEMEIPSVKSEEFNKSTTPDPKIVKEEGTEVTPPAPVTPPKVKLPALPEIKKPEVVPPVPPKPGEAAKPIPKGQRDYSKFQPDDVPFLKQCTNEAFAHFEKKLPAVYEKQKALEAQVEAHAKDPNAIPQNWHNHPKAFMLHPQYERAYGEYQRISMEKGLYNEMIISLDTSGTFKPLLGYDKRTGDAVFGEEVDLSKDNNALARQRLQLQSMAQQAGQQEAQYASGLQQFQNQFAQRYSAAENYSKEIVKEKYPWFTDPAKKDDPRHKQQQEFMSVVPDEFKDHPSTLIASLLWTSLAESAAAYGELAKQLATGKAVAKIQEEVEPSVGSAPSPSDNTNGIKIPGLPKGKVYAGPAKFSVED